MSRTNPRNEYAHLSRKLRRVARMAKRVGGPVRVSGVPLFREVIEQAKRVTPRSPLPKAFDDCTLATTYRPIE